MILRPATPDDAETLAHIHVQSWQETYPGFLPESALAAHTVKTRQAFWTRALQQSQGRTWLLDDLGFAYFGPQREDQWRAKGYVEELYAMYLLRTGYGHGKSLLQAAFGPQGRAFTACVLDSNARACAFYEKAGGVQLTMRAEVGGDLAIKERVYGWNHPPFH